MHLFVLFNPCLQIIELKKLDDAKLKEFNLDGKDCCWCGTEVDIPATAAVVDFVFSDREQRTWDNNGNTDYHSKVVDAASKDSMVEMVYQVRGGRGGGEGGRDKGEGGGGRDEGEGGEGGMKGGGEARGGGREGGRRGEARGGEGRAQKGHSSLDFEGLISCVSAACVPVMSLPEWSHKTIGQEPRSSPFVPVDQSCEKCAVRDSNGHDSFSACLRHHLCHSCIAPYLYAACVAVMQTTKTSPRPEEQSHVPHHCAPCVLVMQVA